MIAFARRCRLGAAARRRVLAGGVIAKGRPSLPLAEYRALVSDLFFNRAGGRCEYCRTTRGPFDPDHVVDRGDGGADSRDNLLILCRRCHDRKRTPYRDGRLRIFAAGQEVFFFMLVRGEKHDNVMLEHVVYRQTGRGPEWTRTVA